MSLKYKVIFLSFIFISAFVLRFYKLGAIPNGLQQDETSIGYNAYSVLKTGKDEHGVFMPQNFQAFGEYKLPGYIYASVLPVAVFGLNAFSIRFISAISGFLSVIVAFFLTKTLIELITINDKKFEFIPYICALLTAINPWSLNFSRAAFEVMLANFFLILGVLLFIKGIEKSKIIFLIISIILLSASMYTYNIARLFTPILILSIFIIFRKKILMLPKLFYVICSVLFFLFITPLITGAINHGGADSTFGTLIFSSAKVQAPLLEFRSYFIDLPTFLNKIIFNYWSLTLWQYINNIVSHFSVSFYFLNGGTGVESIGTTGLWYVFEFPLIIWGAITLIKTKSISSRLIFAWIISLILISSLTREPPQSTRTFFLIFPITLFSSIGLINFIYKIYLLKNTKLKYVILLFSLIIFSSFIFGYFASYYIRFPIYSSKHWRMGDMEVSEYISKHEKEYNKIIIDKDSGIIYSSILSYLKYPPQYFQSSAIWSTPDSEGFTYPVSFGNFEIREINWTKDIKNPKTLIVTTSDRKPLKVASLIAFYYPKRPVVINVGQKIFQYPISEISYVLVDSDKAKNKN